MDRQGVAGQAELNLVRTEQSKLIPGRDRGPAEVEVDLE
jgi:hypothetical protein